jgi:hypothetical protein
MEEAKVTAEELTVKAMEKTLSCIDIFRLR